MRLRFGPAGVPLSYSGPIEGVPAYLLGIGLDAFEYEAVHGVKISEERARRLGEEASKRDVYLSMHAPYYINLASRDPGVFERSIARIVESLRAADWMGAEAVVIHSGYYKDYASKQEALKRVIEGYRRALEEAPGRALIAPETMGKTSQLGTVEETIEICRSVGRCKPCVDWAHLYARSEGKKILSVDEVIKVLEQIERELGREAVNPVHSHFSKIKYGRGGEREHVVLGDLAHGPDWAIVCRAYLEAGYSAVVISESPVLDKDALVMKAICEEIKLKGTS